MLWQISQMTMVQFPARLMPNADFVAITALVMAQTMIGRTYGVRSIAARSQALVLDDRRDAPTAYPIWRVRDERGSIIVPTAQPVTGLVTWPTPAGRHHYRLEPGPAPGERASLLVSFLALMLLGLTLWQPLRTSLRKVLPFTARTSS